jgi:cob(I)alamin adenosyltransferase
MRYFTGKGDQGKSSLADGRLISKGELIFDVIGALDEATAHIGMAISLCQDLQIINTLRIIQDQLSKLMGLLAGVKIQDLENEFFFKVSIKWLEGKINEFGGTVDFPEGFLFAGSSSEGAAVDIARTVIRRAERDAVKLFGTIKDHGNDELIYLNRLSSLLFVIRLLIDRKSIDQE